MFRDVVEKTRTVTNQDFYDQVLADLAYYYLGLLKLFNGDEQRASSYLQAYYG